MKKCICLSQSRQECQGRKVNAGLSLRLCFLCPYAWSLYFLLALSSCNSPGDNNKNNNVSFAYGIDISKYQGDEIDFLNKNKDSLSFVICKATEGISIIDPDFRNNWTMIKTKGFIRGAYHFYHCSDSIVSQSQNFLSALDALEPSDLPPIIDFEEAGTMDCPRSEVQKNLLAFLTLIEKETGRIPMIYTDDNTAMEFISDTAFAKYPLYIADYSKSPSPLLPDIWKPRGWAIWQKTDSLKLAGSYDDFDMYNGNLSDLKNFIRDH